MTNEASEARTSLVAELRAYAESGANKSRTTLLLHRAANVIELLNAPLMTGETPPATKGVTEAQKFLRLIAEGYFSAAIAARFVRVENPKFHEDNGEDPYLIYDTFAALSLPKALSTPAAGGLAVKALEWQETHTDRGDGTSEATGWEAGSGFGSWYEIIQYFGSDSFGWQVRFDCDLIADKDDPEAAKAAAQSDFETRILSALDGAR